MSFWFLYVIFASANFVDYYLNRIVMFERRVTNIKILLQVYKLVAIYIMLLCAANILLIKGTTCYSNSIFWKAFNS